MADTKSEIGRILQQTKCLEFCDIIAHRSDEHYAHTINLPFSEDIYCQGRRSIYGFNPSS